MDVVQEIKLRVDLVELISAYVPLRRAGRTHKGLCPFHSEKTPSFVVDGERGFYRCYGCGASGDCFSFLQQREGIGFSEAGEMLARRAGLEWTRQGETAEKRSQRQRLYDVNALAERFFREQLERAPEVRKYLTGRGVLPETQEEFRLGYAPGGYEALLGWLKRQKVSIEDAEAADLVLRGERGLRDRFVDRVIFPIFDLEGRAIAFAGRALQADAIPKYLNSRETDIFSKGRTLYGLHRAKQAIPKAGFTVAVEGYMDLIALHQAGVDNSVASMGTAITETAVGILRRYSTELVFCYDGDSAGLRAAERNSAMFERAEFNVRVAQLPSGEDPDTFLRGQGSDAFRALLARAEPLLDYQINGLRLKYDLSRAEARLPFVREAARVIAASGSHLTRQEYQGKLGRILERLCEEWYPGQPHEAMQARQALSQEVRRLLAPADRNGRRSGRPGEIRGSAPTPAVGSSGLAQAERYVLRAALSEDRWAAEVAERLAPEHFTEPELAGIVETLLGSAADEGEAPRERAERIRSDAANAGVVSRLLIEETPLDDEGLERCVAGLERARKERRREALSRAFAEGALSDDDPRRTELLGLISELGGRQRRED